jgi:hypothetical protein
MAIGTTTAPNVGFTDSNNTTKPQAIQNAPEQLPYQQVNNTDNIIPLTAQAANPQTNGSQQAQQVVSPTAQGVSQGNTAVLAKAQETALNQGANPLSPLVTQQTANYVSNPNLGFNYQQYNQSALEDYDMQQAQAQEAARQQLANTSQSGELQNQFLRNQMNVAAGRQGLQAKNDYAAAQANQQNMINALAAGRAGQEGINATSTSQIGNLATVRGMGEGERAQTTGFVENQALTQQGFDNQTQLAAQQNGYDLAKLGAQFGNDMAKMVATQNWTGAQAQLDREAQVALQSNDINAKNAIQDKQNAFDMQKSISTQDWQGGQAALDRQMQQALQSNDINAKTKAQQAQNDFDMAKLNKTQDWQSAQNKIQQDFQLAMQSNDIQATSANVQKQLDLDKWKQENGQKFTAEQNAINNALQLSLKSMDVQGQKDIMELKGNIDKGMLTDTQLFDAAQANLDRELKAAMQTNDTAAQVQVTTLKGQIDAAAQKNQQDFTAAQTQAAQSWQTGERVSTQDFERISQSLDISAKKAMQSNDLNAQKAIEGMRENNALYMQTQDMNQQSKMAYLNAQLTEATAKNDVGRQEQIIGFQTQQDMAMAAKQGTLDQAKISLQGQIQSALSKQDSVQALALQKSAQIFQGTEDAKNRALEQQKIELQKAGFDYDALQTAIAAGQITPDAAVQFLKDATGDLGITIQKPDSLATQAEITKKFNDTKFQWGLSNTSALVDPKDPSKGLTTDGEAAFAAYYNKTLFGTGDPGTGTLNAVKIDPTSASRNGATVVFNNPPAPDSYFTFGGNTYKRVGDQMNTDGFFQKFQAIDQKTGQQVIIQAGNGVVSGTQIASTNNNAYANSNSKVRSDRVMNGTTSG